MKIFVPKESASGECRVAATGQSVAKLVKLGYEVAVQRGCGEAASINDQVLEAAGAVLADDANAAWQTADLVLKILPPTPDEISRLRQGATIISFIWPATNVELTQRLAERGVTALAMDCVPRISRAQKLDALSSMANIAGYRAVIEAAYEFGSFFTGQITAAGKVPPAKVLVIGAGVAGLAAIGAARSLGAIVRAFDTRPAVAEQVRSMGAEFLMLEFKEDGEGAGGYAKTMSPEFIAAEMALFARQARDVDIIITTALIPGKPAPKLITAGMVRSMKPGSVIVDMAAEQGGNCELTQPGKKAEAGGVTIIGYTDLPGRLPTQASTLYANNLVNFLNDLTPGRDGKLVIDLADEVTRGALVTHEGAVTWPPPAKALAAAASQPAASPVGAMGDKAAASGRLAGMGRFALPAFFLLAGVLLLFIGRYAPADFVSRLTVFALACLVGYQVIWNVTPALHTPLMSVTNAISGIIVIGGLIQIGSPWYGLSSLFAAAAVLLATINIAGGFFVTQRMLGMFRKQDS